jgi:hypothetical protein
MKSKLILCLAVVLSGCLPGCSTSSRHASVSNAEIDKYLTKQISEALLECQTIKPDMTRAELLKVFTTEGGLSTAEHRTFVFRRCPYIKVDVDFIPSKKTTDKEQPTDMINGISKPYLDWSILD